jgi:hypothetical protein
MSTKVIFASGPYSSRRSVVLTDLNGVYAARVRRVSAARDYDVVSPASAQRLIGLSGMADSYQCFRFSPVLSKTHVLHYLKFNLEDFPCISRAQ